MDKVKIALIALKKHHFWVLTVLIFIIALVVWYLGTGDLAAQTAKRASELKTTMGQIDGIKRDPSHQNEKTIAQMETIHGTKHTADNAGVAADPAADKASLVNNVLSAWTNLFEKQRKDNKLPPVFIQTPPNGTPQEQIRQQEFVDAFMKLWGPMENIEKLPADQGLDDINRTHYQNHIQSYFPKLFDMIDRRHEEVIDAPPDAAASTAPGAADEKKTKLVGIVDWDDAEKVMAHFSEWKDSPSTLQVMMAQEDLWVYETLLKVIRNTNNQSTEKLKYIPPDTHKVAPIKRIIRMEIGQEAIVSWTEAENKLINLGSDATQDATTAAAPAPMPMRGASVAAFGRGGATETGQKVSPLAGRYLDDKGKPLTDPTQQPYAEFRMMPINLRVIIEQKWIPKLLTECANSAMPIEVRAVRILGEAPPPFEPAAPDDAAATAANPGMRGPVPGAPMTERGGHFGRGGFGRGGQGGFGASRDSVGDSLINESIDSMAPAVEVEIQGIINIYNPPDREKLGTGTAVAAGGASTDVPVAAPAAQTPPNTAPTASPNPPAAPPAGGPPPGSPPPEGSPPANNGPAAATPGIPAKGGQP